jgi:phospholipid-binding lipoprotein MlaA
MKSAHQTRLRLMVASLGAAALVAMSGCATAPSAKTAEGASSAGGTAAVAPPPIDPWENWNRKVYGFNDAVDRAVLKPVAETYQKIVPSLVRTGVSNVLGNIKDVWSAANHVLQGKFMVGMEMGMRVLVNSSFGLGGLLDPATEMRLEKRPTDFGLTLGKWGLGNGPYMMLPLLGPSTLRDSAGYLVDRNFAASKLPPTTGGQVAVTTVEVVNARASFLNAGQLMDQVALDKYSFLRDAYLSRRRDALYDGAPPMENFDDEADDAATKPAKPGAAPEPGTAGPGSAPAVKSPAPPAAAASAVNK